MFHLQDIWNIWSAYREKDRSTRFLSTSLYPNDSTEHGAALEDLRRSSECCFLLSQVVSCDIFDMSLVSFCRFSSMASS